MKTKIKTKTKTYEGSSLQELETRARKELGDSMTVISSREKRARGLLGFLKKPVYFITVSYEEIEKETKSNSSQFFTGKFEPDPTIAELDNEGRELVIALQDETIKNLEKKILDYEQIVTDYKNQLVSAKKAGAKVYANESIQICYDALTAQGVDKNVAADLLKEIENISDIDPNTAIKITYNKIISVIGEPGNVIESIEPKRGIHESKVAVFLGPTGVGKTTTIAKLASNLTLKDDLRVGFMTSDTYRIAAVEQLKTYANILGTELEVIYGLSEINSAYDKIRTKFDLIFFDTAGRSHKNSENLKEVKEILKSIPDSYKYLVLNVSARQEELLDIIKKYEEITEFDLVFSKIDEAFNLGIILNVCYFTGKNVSYVTYGQSVPDDIEVMQPNKLARALLSGGGYIPGEA